MFMGQRTAGVLAAAVFLVCTGIVYSAETEPVKEVQTVKEVQPAKDADQLQERCKAFVNRMQTMHAEMKAMDARLDQKLTAMNTAKGDAKITAMADVISELAAQRKTQRQRYDDLSSRTLWHGMDHGAMTSTKEGRECLANCMSMLSEVRQKTAVEQAQPASVPSSDRQR